jgi:hypothetical protein
VKSDGADTTGRNLPPGRINKCRRSSICFCPGGPTGNEGRAASSIGHYEGFVCALCWPITTRTVELGLAPCFRRERDQGLGIVERQGDEPVTV